ncbi:MAG: hypothetical protein M3R55_10335 [Acidobacteriota bacterium]|nr:hypothetical protein [Acidobacteriota bacterium]
MDNLNLTNERGGRNVWDEAAGADLVSRLRTIDTGSYITAVSGAALTFMGLRRRGISGGLLTAVGGMLVYRALAGSRDVAHARAWTSGTLHGRGYGAGDTVEESLEESFPASDPPSTSPTTQGPRPVV